MFVLALTSFFQIMIQIGYFKGCINKVKHKKGNDEWNGVFGEGKGIDQ